MTDRLLYCNGCGIHVATIRDGKIKKGMVCYCPSCNAIRELSKKPVDMPEFFKDIFK